MKEPKQRRYITLFKDEGDYEEAFFVDKSFDTLEEDSEQDSLFTRNIKEGYNSVRPWRGFVKCLTVLAPIFLTGCILVKCIRKLVE